MRGVEFALPEEASARRAFSRAVETWNAANFIHERARDNLLARLDFIRLTPGVILDVGCGTGHGLQQLRSGYPEASLVGLDSCTAMCRSAAGLMAEIDTSAVLASHGEHLPIADDRADLILANLCLPWCRPDRVFSEIARTLSPRGLFLFSTLGPDTLGEVRRAWANVDDKIHVHAAFDMHDLGDLAAAAGLRDPVMDVDRLRLSYADVGALVRDLRATGGVNTALGRRRSLTGARRWKQFDQALSADTVDGRFEVTVELVFGQAWGPQTSPGSARPATIETRVPIADIQRRRP